MELLELMQGISKNNVPHYMIWFGEEQKILDMYIEQISKFYKPVRVGSVAYVFNQLRMKSLDKSSKVYIVTEDTEYSKEEKVWQNVKDMFSKSPHILILRYATIDKKVKFYTHHKQESIEFVHLQPEILTQYIQRDVDLSDSNCDKLCKMCNNDYGRISLELDKLKHYYTAMSIEAEICMADMDYNECFDNLLNQSAIYCEIGDITFELTNAVLGGYPDKAIQKLDEAKRKGEPTLRICSILYEGFRNLVAYTGLGKDKQNAGVRTGLTGWQIKQCIDLSGGYNMKELIRNMLLCQRVESGVKTGTIEEDTALEYLVLHCLH
jgi:DNA polymerase III delta subunit